VHNKTKYTLTNEQATMVIKFKKLKKFLNKITEIDG